jgi:hypothetical protein
VFEIHPFIEQGMQTATVLFLPACLLRFSSAHRHFEYAVRRPPAEKAGGHSYPKSIKIIEL